MRRQLLAVEPLSVCAILEPPLFAGVSRPKGTLHPFELVPAKV